jgi:Glutamyl- and glutaminyl-tRNA synthetases
MKSQTNTSSDVIVRMAPSPTGQLHIGGARTALFNFLFAKHHKGKYVLRIEDTDKERSTKEFEKNIFDSFDWLGLKHDEMYRQSERTEIYVSYVRKMIDDGKAYVSKEEPQEKDQRAEVIRFKNPNKRIKFDDLIRGEVEFDTTDLGDFVLARSIEEPLYHLAVVVDDHEMGITHVMRGEEHISNTPRQILIQEAIGARRPIYAHLPLILDSDRKKLSKRKHGEIVWVDFYKNKGILPEAILNYLALLGWNPGTEQEIFTLEELIKAFDIKKVQKAGAIFDEKKLDWVNKEHIKLLPEEEQFKLLLKSIENEDYLKSAPTLDLSKINWKSVDAKKTKEHLEKVLELLDDKDKIMAYADEAGRGDVLWPLRFSLSGREKSPDPFTLIKVLGVPEAKKRVSKAIELL